ncbi:NAD(P)/FAD-dependent oxidoreductase [Bacillus sp. 1P10SD]|uniref:NAD(P)/FAD-dependent oxidoreductase n=1 Tax=Bacillus sp. 1P10SD TaxID=3132265 RepID=UPI0039A60E05
MEQQDLFDVIIIGGGPAGLYSAFYSGLREMKTKIIEYQSELGGKLHIYPEKMIWDVGGVTPVPGAELMKQLVEQGLTFNPEVVLNEKVISINKSNNDIFELKTASGQVHMTKTVIVAVGSGILKPQKLKIDGAERFELSNLHYTVQSLHQFKDKTVLISGGGNSAIDWAIELESIAKQVYITHRRGAFSGHESQITQLINSSTVCYFDSSITKLIASRNHELIERVVLTNNTTGEVTYLPVDEVVVNHGYEQDTTLLKNSPLNISMKDDYYISGNALSESSIEGLYAAGDILTYEGKLNLIAGAFQDAANAVNKAKLHIQPDANSFAMVSSHNDRFKSRNKDLVKKMLKK